MAGVHISEAMVSVLFHKQMSSEIRFTIESAPIPEVFTLKRSLNNRGKYKNGGLI